MEIDFPNPLDAPDDCDLIAVGAIDEKGRRLVSTIQRDWPALTEYGSTWDPDVLLAAYRRGLFPMPFEVNDDLCSIGWWSPQPRAVFPYGSLKVSRTMKRAAKKFRVTIDQCFEDVIRQCADPNRPQGWISESVIDAFTHLHKLGYAHSFETWNSKGDLVGGLYGVEVGGVFAGESMFHLENDASKVALMSLVDVFLIDDQHLIDTQWMTPHLDSLGAVEIPRAEYISRLTSLQSVPTRFVNIGGKLKH